MQNYQDRLIEAMARQLDDETFERVFIPDGSARQALWRCEDGWIVGYTTARVRGGRFHDKFAVMAYKPVGKGARTGKASQHERVYFRGFSSRKTARKRAEAIYERHSRA